MYEPTILQHDIKLGRNQDQATAALTKRFKPYSRVFNLNPNPDSTFHNGRREMLLVEMVLRLQIKTQKHHLKYLQL